MNWIDYSLVAGYVVFLAVLGPAFLLRQGYGGQVAKAPSFAEASEDRSAGREVSS